MIKILREIKMGQGDGLFAIIVDETTDICNKEQISICIRHIGADFIPVESFLGFVETASISGESLYKPVRDVLCSLQLNLEKCRGQGYDGAANMRGKFKGLAARVKADYPLSLFSYCSGHCLNQILQDSCKSLHCIQASDTIRNIVGYIRDSPKRQSNFEAFLHLGDINAGLAYDPYA